MSKAYLRNMVAYGWAVILLPAILSGCRTHIPAPIATPPASGYPTLTLVTTPSSLLTSTSVPRRTATPQRTPSPTASSTITPSKTATSTATPTPITPGTVSKDLLMTIEEKLFFSIGILPAGETNPQILLREPYHSYEDPSWAHNGEWIAFRQRDNGIHVDHLGIIRKDGTGKRILKPKFGVTSGPVWSADDRMLVARARTSNGGFMPYAVDIETEEMIDLLPESEVHLGYSQLKLSPKAMQAVFMNFEEESPVNMELWLLSLDGSRQDMIPIPTDVSVDCMNLYFPVVSNIIEWSPDGMAFLVQFYETSQTDCRPSLWLYNLREKNWSNVIRVSETTFSMSPLPWKNVSWSPDGRWISWIRRDGGSIYSTSDWQMVREIDFGLGMRVGILDHPWVKDDNGNAIFSVVRILTIMGLTHTEVIIRGLSPNGAEASDTILVHIKADEPPWIPIGSFWPYMWQP
jgi:hypothetical protein